MRFTVFEEASHLNCMTINRYLVDCATEPTDYTSQSKNSYLSGMNMKEAIQHSPQEFLRLCRSHDVKLLYAFGSSVNDRFKEDTSDIDLLVELSTEDPAQRGENLMNLWDQFEQFFQRKVDLLSIASIRNPILKRSIDASKVLVYDGTELKVAF